MSKSKIKLTNGVFCSLSELPVKENLFKLDSVSFYSLPKVSYFGKFTHDFRQGFEDKSGGSRGLIEDSNGCYSQSRKKTKV